MKRFLSFAFFLCALGVALPAGAQNTHARATAGSGGYPITPVPFTSVKVTDSFWGQRLEASREVTIPLAFSKCESEGRYNNFVMAAHPNDTLDVSKVMLYSFDDTDVYKTLEGASYLLQTYPNPRLEAYMDSVIVLIGAAQEADGYLYPARTINPQKPHHWAGTRRWELEEDLSHELYNLGHMIEGAVAHYQATGSRKFLDIAIRFADCVVREVGPNPGQSCVVPGHQIAEMALCKLYLATGKKEYLDEAKFLLDYRGKTTIQTEYSQSHKPVLEQDEAVGHAVRASYMYAGMADVAALTGDSTYIHAIDRIWENIVQKKYYITGGIGATNNGEAFGHNYELPNMSAYCETCAAIGNVYVNHRLFLLHGESKYYDVLERTLYNGLLSGISLDGGAFFYPNPLESIGQHRRQPWFGCACCPSNVARFIPSLPGYVYAVNGRQVYVNLFMSNTSTLKVEGKDLILSQETQYPWNGDIRLRVEKNSAGAFALRVRIPGWVRDEVVPSNLYYFADSQRPSYTVLLNGAPVQSELQEGYFVIDRKWKKGDRIEVQFSMEPRIIKSHPAVQANAGRIAIERGPIVYCAEWADNKDFSVLSLLMNQEPRLNVDATPLLINEKYPVVTLSTQAQVLLYDEKGCLQTRSVDLRLIPYYAWNHRGAGEMSVWLPQEVRATRPQQPATLASESKVESSHNAGGLTAINDRLVPKDAFDRSAPYFHYWPKTATTEWLTYEFPAPATIKSSTVYWFDDGPWGGCRVPEGWQIYYLDGQDQWQPVSGASAYGTAKGVANTVRFDPVTTKKVKLEIKQPAQFSTGLFEWEVK